jgi:hypothetical protein
MILTTKAKSSGGFYAINEGGQVLLTNVNHDTSVPFIKDTVCSLLVFSSFGGIYYIC